MVGAIFTFKGNKMRYTVITFNIGGYEVLHEIPKEAINDSIDYLYITDDHSITSSTWSVIYDDGLTGSTFDKVFQIRYNPFRYTDNEVVMKIDGSMAIVKDLMPLFKFFDEGGYDCAMMIHPTRNTMYDEYLAWVQLRGYPIEQANRSLVFMASNGYDVRNYKGLFQYNFIMQRNNEINNRLKAETYNLLKMNAPKGETVDRLDQTLGSFVINTHYPELKILPVGQYVCVKDFYGGYFDWCMHGTEIPMVYDSSRDTLPYMRNEPVVIPYL